MKKPFILLLIFSLCLSSAGLRADEDDLYDEDEDDLPEPTLIEQTGHGSAFGSADATAISMGIWGVALAVGIGLAATLIKARGSDASTSH